MCFSCVWRVHLHVLAVFLLAVKFLCKASDAPCQIPIEVKSSECPLLFKCGYNALLALQILYYRLDGLVGITYIIIYEALSTNDVVIIYIKMYETLSTNDVVITYIMMYEALSTNYVITYIMMYETLSTNDVVITYIIMYESLFTNYVITYIIIYEIAF